MLAASWEVIAEEMINVANPEEFSKKLETLYQEKGLGAADKRGVVLVARDTRPHSEGLMKLACRGVELAGGVAHDIGVATTPQLHYAVARFNAEGLPPVPVDGLVEDYYSTLCGGFEELLATADAGADAPRQSVTVDCANGVGSVSLKEFVPRLHCVDIDPRNEAYSGPVNEGCGAEHCQKLQIPPATMTKATRYSGVLADSEVRDGHALKCSLDGDADRIVFHTFGEGATGEWTLFDGDKIACLVAFFVGTELAAAGLTPAGGGAFKFGVVQTAYANGASTRYLRAQNIPVLFAKTGVKYCHQVAHDAFDCGVYFEANGHGTVLFADQLSERIRAGPAASDAGNARCALAFRRLQASLRVINQVTGDAISDMLLCLAVLQVYSMSAEQWSALYRDLPSRQIKCKVSDKSLISCSEDEMRVVQPAALQERLDAAMAGVEQGRCFIRPSGTEDVVRIYAEASGAEGIATLVADATRAIEELIK
jgi:phosphoacetylglucosamine mutase